MQTIAERLAEGPFEELTVAGGRARAVVRRAHAERLCDGHFPGDPIVPGAYLAGLMAEVAAALLATPESARRPTGGAGEPPRLSAIEDCAFVRPVVPYEPICIAARFARATAGDERRVEAQVWTRGACAARATLRFTEGT